MNFYDYDIEVDSVASEKVCGGVIGGASVVNSSLRDTKDMSSM